MKIKRILPLCILCMLLFPTAVYAKSVPVTIPSFPVTVNRQTMESMYNQYPLLLYKDITYFPMAYDYARFLGVKANWYETCREYGEKSVLFVGVAEERAKELKIISTKTPNQKRYTATVAEYGIALNTTNPKKFLDNRKEEYPILNFRGITYFPLTWKFAVEEFGWEYSYDKQNGLRIESGNPFRPIISDGIIGSTLPRATWTDYYYGKEYYVEYPLSPFGNNDKFIVRKRGEPEREFSLGNQIQGDCYFNVTSEPSITDNIFSVECKKYTSDSGESRVLLKINLDTGKVVVEEDRAVGSSSRRSCVVCTKMVYL
ncbi:hypothetical protein [Sinanaerobacter chloroacetimidivorans]|uniref:Uncharacterized protein n=1 Tax=Sinanaerobacter chloroacetimidivorans TaxID=2818044 RepID=A0A8J8B185_9FIRM|nr:hypothetical protein [Sinanaerobacter chloroacetimidivorans]MBR0597487.1 hypothetical protein [Sinanaerobacter chloroacetimidivorans]